jgi:hypothetical protein
MKHLKQALDTKNDSFSYTVLGEESPIYLVDSFGYLLKTGKQIGNFRLTDKQWHLYIDDTLFMSGPENSLFGLPEFELKALTKLINQ